MFAVVTARNNNRIAKLNIEDILAIQQHYGIKNPKPTTTTAQYGFAQLFDHAKRVITVRESFAAVVTVRVVVATRLASLNVTFACAQISADVAYMDFLPDNFSLSAAYQRPSGELVLFVHDVVYMVEYPSFKLKEGWPKRLSSLGFPPNIFVNTAVNTNRGQTYVIFNNNDVEQIDECNMGVRSYHSLQAVFLRIPSAPTLAFRYMDGNLYFAKKTTILPIERVHENCNKGW
ncbi:hypothetical protein ALC57_08561 [Trachymyrmex cornetzi]|uniref:Matrix metalloproteinase-14 n=1 Tax=Trachymyrmex cornetzi TaxID=471704 RepID=A0A151J6V4_9HYME|nr:hypothetical protein ALC57_08561 [Trachymyrmex cornetzi]